jgi:hypothetical protein
MQALVAASAASGAWRTIRAQPFVRQAYDLAAALARVDVDAAGHPVAPASRGFWLRVGDSPELPGDPAGMLAASPDERPVDAAWLASLTNTSDVQLRADRLDQFAFSQRVFGGTPPGAIPDVFVATRAFRRYRKLMLTLERIGIRDPATYAAAARLATRLSPPDSARAFVATAQFQGALLLLWRMRMVGTLDAAGTDALVASLIAVPLNSLSQYQGGILRWLDQDLRGAIPPVESLEAAVQAAVAGPDATESGPRIEWEGKRYRIDVAAAERRRLEQVREKQGGATLDLALDLAAQARRLASAPPAIGMIRDMRMQLTSLVAEGFADAGGLPDADGFPPGVAPPPGPRESAVKAIDELGRISGGAARGRR